MGWEEGSRRAIVAIDFGTYGSGYAWMVVNPQITDPKLFRIAEAWWNGPDDGVVSCILLPAYTVDGVVIGRTVVATTPSQQPDEATNEDSGR